jgi:hypothetical protein
MFRRIRTFFDGKPLVGDQVTVLSGPYRGRPGRSSPSTRAARLYIDECCQPRLSRDEIRREWNGRWMRDRQRKVRDNDPEGDWARYLLDQER